MDIREDVQRIHLLYRIRLNVIIFEGSFESFHGTLKNGDNRRSRSYEPNEIFFMERRTGKTGGSYL